VIITKKRIKHTVSSYYYIPPAAALPALQFMFIPWFAFTLSLLVQRMRLLTFNVIPRYIAPLFVKWRNKADLNTEHFT
jgi:hypothetical protein